MLIRDVKQPHVSKLASSHNPPGITSNQPDSLRKGYRRYLQLVPAAFSRLAMVRHGTAGFFSFLATVPWFDEILVKKLCIVPCMGHARVGTIAEISYAAYIHTYPIAMFQYECA